MTKTVPKKFTSVLPPAIVTTPNGRFLIITGETDAGWYPVSKKFTYEQAIKGWTRTTYSEQSQPTSDWTWKVANSKGNGFYTVTFDKSGWSCDCTGFGFRRKCRHIEEAKTKMN